MPTSRPSARSSAIDAALVTRRSPRATPATRNSAKNAAGAETNPRAIVANPKKRTLQKFTVRGCDDRRQRCDHDERRKCRERSDDRERKLDARAIGQRAAGERAQRVTGGERRGVPAHHRSGSPPSGEVDRDREVVGPERT